MSSYANIFIEYKDSRNNDWHLLRAYVPLEDREYDRNKAPEELAKIAVDLGGKLYCKSESLVRCGIVRDLLNDQSKRFYGRDFPHDLSIDLQEILQLEQEEIELLNIKDPGTNHDWRYGKSWCYLSELREAIEESYSQTIKYYLEDRLEAELGRIYSKLDQIYDHLVPQDPNAKGEPKLELKDYSCLDDLDDLIYAKGFCDHVEGLIDFVTDMRQIDGNIRLIYYTE